MEYRPSLAVLEVVATDLASIERAQQLESSLLSMLLKSEQFEPVISPSQVLERAGELELHCTERACFEAVRARLDVQRVARLTVEQHDGGSRVTLLGLDPAVPELIRFEIDRGERPEVFRNLTLRTPAERDLAFLRMVVPHLRGAFRALAAPNSKLVVKNPDPDLTVLIDGKPIRSGRFEVTTRPTSLWVTIGGITYEPYARLVTLKPAQLVTVDLGLVLTKRTYKGVMSRPAIYVAMSGLTLLGVGLGFGLSTLIVQARVDEGGRPVAVTRLEALSAPNHALLASLLVGTGAALSVFGITWLAITPSRPTGSNAQGWNVAVGGTY